MIPQRMTKFFRLLIGIVTLAALFSGCGPAKTTTTGSQTQERATSQSSTSEPSPSDGSGQTGNSQTDSNVANDKVSFEPPSYRAEYGSDNSSTTPDEADGKGGIASDSNASTGTGRNIVSSSNMTSSGSSSTYSTTANPTDPVFHGVVDGQYAGTAVFHGMNGANGVRQFHAIVTRCPNSDIYTPSSCFVPLNQSDPIFHGVVR